MAKRRTTAEARVNRGGGRKGGAAHAGNGRARENGRAKGDPAAVTAAAAGREAPPFRRLRAFAFDPGVDRDLETAVINQVTLKVPWEADLAPGPVGEYLEVIDVDPASDAVYAPVDLNQPELLATDGLAPSDGNPKFHQQMVYAVAMSTIRNFERALGRRALWSPRLGKEGMTDEQERARYVQRLRIYPHAMREANAYYSPWKKALLFGYFPASPGDGTMPGGMVFTCLSHDVIAHETTHALLDGMHRRFIEATNPDVLAFHEAFADIVALFQHFSHPEVLRHQIATTRGDLAGQSLLGQLAQEVGQAVGHRGALRSAIGAVDPADGQWKPLKPDPAALDATTEPHDRGAILVAAVFDAFVSIYKSRVADLLRIATNGTGVLPAGAIHPDLVNRLADEAAKSSQHVLNMCIRALDYCPPVDLTFGEYLRALITADFDLVRDDDRGYRLAMIEAFRRRGIYPRDVRTLSVDSLLWQPPAAPNLMDDFFYHFLVDHYSEKLREFARKWDLSADRRGVYDSANALSAALHEWMAQNPRMLEDLLPGIQFTDPDMKFEIHSLRPSRRIGPDGDFIAEMIVEITQRKRAFLDAGREGRQEGLYTDKGGRAYDFYFRGGYTLVVDFDRRDVRYAIAKNIDSRNRLERQRAFLAGSAGASLHATYFGDSSREPLAALHRHF